MCCIGQCQELTRPGLTDREREVLVEWLRSDSKSGAGARLFITRATVATHIDRIRRKYNEVGRPASTKAILTIRAIQDGIVTVEGLQPAAPAFERQSRAELRGGFTSNPVADR